MFFGWFRRRGRSDRQIDYEAVGRQVAAMYDAIHPDRHALYRTAFLRGIFTGVGTVVGATLVIALLAAILSWFHHIPLLGPLSDSVRSTIQERR